MPEWDAAALAHAITETAHGCVLQIRVIPRASRTWLDGVRGEALLVRLAAPPVDGAANDALLRFLAEWFEVPRRSVSLIAGDRARDKRVRIEGLTREEALRRLSTAR
jgi:uncharacterized protein (TIGR00251 family)